MSDHQEISRIHPFTKSGAKLAYVGTIFFQTKRYNLDSKDLDLLAQLATAYVACSKGLLKCPECTRHKAKGLSGLVLGYADPRSSTNPDNKKLSELRAKTVALQLTKYLSEKSFIGPAFFDIKHEGEGTEAIPLQKNKVIAEGNIEAPSRRADIYITGQAVEINPMPLAQKIQKPRKVPKINARFLPLVRKGHKPTIRGIAANCRGFIELNKDHRLIIYTMFNLLPPVKPPWLDKRLAGIYASAGRSAARNKLVYKALLLMNLWDVFDELSTKHWDGSASTLARYRDEFVKRKPNQARLLQLKKPLQHVYYVYKEAYKLSKEVFNLC